MAWMNNHITITRTRTEKMLLVPRSVFSTGDVGVVSQWFWGHNT